MGRRPKVANDSEKALKMPKATYLSLNQKEQQPECASPQKEKTYSVFGNDENSTQLSLSREKAKHQKFPIRRSQRIQNIIVPVPAPAPAPNRDIKLVVQEIVDSDKEEERLAFEEENVPEQYVSKENVSEQCASEKENVSEQYASEEEELPSPISEEKTLGAKIDHLETVKLKVKKSSFPSNSADLRYKSLYIDSQKKVEALTKEKNELALKLENALGKLEAFEKGIPGLSEIQKLKDIIFIQQLTKATEAAVNVSSQAVHHAFSSEDDAGYETGTAAKRKKAPK